jgi:hypothetical protein
LSCSLITQIDHACTVLFPSSSQSTFPVKTRLWVLVLLLCLIEEQNVTFSICSPDTPLSPLLVTKIELPWGRPCHQLWYSHQLLLRRRRRVPIITTFSTVCNKSQTTVKPISNIMPCHPTIGHANYEIRKIWNPKQLCKCVQKLFTGINIIYPQTTPYKPTIQIKPFPNS